jgi:hypothetical protein
MKTKLIETKVDNQKLLDFLYDKFNEFNKLYFEDSIPPVPIRLTTTSSHSGSCYAKFHRITNELVIDEITISLYYIKNNQQLVGILAHEMVHAWFMSKCRTGRELKEYERINGVHGKEFVKFIKELSKKSGIDIPLTDNITQEVSDIIKSKIFYILVYSRTYNNLFAPVGYMLFSEIAWNKLKRDKEGIQRLKNTGTIKLFKSEDRSLLRRQTRRVLTQWYVINDDIKKIINTAEEIRI